MELEVFDHEGVPVVAVSGELDISGTPELDARLGRLVDAGHVHLVVDLNCCDFVDCGGLGVLVGHLTRVRSRDGDIAVVCTRPRILRVLQLTGLAGTFPLASSRSEAVTALRPRSAVPTPQAGRPEARSAG